MVAGMSAYTLLHVLLSLVAILSGFIVLLGFPDSRQVPVWTPVFVWTTIATTLTGFGFPFNGITPAIVTGIVSTIVLAVLLVALYLRKQAGGWRTVYVITAMVALYLNVFVLIVQLFLKVPALHAFAPQGKEPPFAIAQAIALLFFIVAGYRSVKRVPSP